MARYLRNTLTGDITTVLEDDDAAYVSLIAQRQTGGLPARDGKNRPLYEVVTLADPAVTPHSGPGGGGGAPTNWCVVSFAPVGGPLTVGDLTVSEYHYAPGDMSISSQSGSDFSIAEVGGDPTNGGVFTTKGGLFLTATYIGSATDATLDGGSTATRYVQFGAIGGNGSNPPNQNGWDALMPIIAGQNASSAAICFSSGPAYCNPGDPAFQNFSAILISGFGTDSVPLDNTALVAVIFQIG